MKKSPVTYNNETYEVRWWHNIFDYIGLYKVYPNRILFKKERVYTLNLVYMSKEEIEEKLHCKIDPEELYIYQAKLIVHLYNEYLEETARKKILKETRKDTLKGWDGIC